MKMTPKICYQKQKTPFNVGVCCLDQTALGVFRFGFFQLLANLFSFCGSRFELLDFSFRFTLGLSISLCLLASIVLRSLLCNGSIIQMKNPSQSNLSDFSRRTNTSVVDSSTDN